MRYRRRPRRCRWMLGFLKGSVFQRISHSCIEIRHRCQAGLIRIKPRFAPSRGSAEMACSCGVAGGFLGLTFREWLASVISLRLWKETVMDTTVSGIGAVVVAELRAAGYMESAIGQYAKTIKALTEFASGREYSTSLGAEFASMTTSVRTGRFSLHRRFDYRRLVTTEGDGWDC